jgi:alkanesulfonate monooxygenase SsuD/methylene tetrahydromethanopterin reductase-like flavin-dependent oxidoreductase (luciferase family)
MLPVQDLGLGVDAPLRIAVEAERLGLDSLWVGDHLSFRHPIIESVVTASMVAAVTRDIRLGFGVLQLAMRHPVWIAKQLSTLAVLSGERLELGVGVGGENPSEWAAAGIPVDERVGRTNELLAVMPKLLSGQPVTHSGRYYSFESPALLPAPRNPVSIWMGGRSDGALRRAATSADGWLGLWVDVPAMERSVAALDEFASEAGRRRPTAALVVPVVIDANPTKVREQFSRFMREHYGVEYERVARWCVGGTTEEITVRLCELLDAGCTGFVLSSVATDPLGQLNGLMTVRSGVQSARGSHSMARPHKTGGS